MLVHFLFTLIFWLTYTVAYLVINQCPKPMAYRVAEFGYKVKNYLYRR